MPPSIANPPPVTSRGAQYVRMSTEHLAYTKSVAPSHRPSVRTMSAKRDRSALPTLGMRQNRRHRQRHRRGAECRYVDHRLTRTGNMAGLDAATWAQLASASRQSRLASAAQQLLQAGADYVAEDLPAFVTVV
jgi:hypothetical protein